METKEFSFDPLPEGFMLPKPVNSVTDEVILKLERQGRLAITRKRDGYRVWAVKDRTVKLYTRGLNEVTAYFPHVVAELETVMPPGSFLDGEMFCEKDGKDDFPTVAALFKAGTAHRTICPQEEQGHVRFMIFDVIFWNGEKYISKPWIERAARLMFAILGWKPFEEMLHTGLNKNTHKYLIPVQTLTCSFEEAQKMVKQFDWEGLVLYDTQGCADFRLDGKVSRPRVAWKRKPFTEDDFIVRQWIPRENDPTMLKEMRLSQINPETGKEIDCGKCGTGFSNQERKELANNALYPLVVEIKFMERFPSGKLRHPSFLRVRDDKKSEECIFEKEE